MKNLIYDDILRKYPDVEFTQADDFDSAVIGVETGTMRLIYSIDYAITFIMFSQEMNRLEAEDFFLDKVLVEGEDFPIWCDDYFL